MSKTVIRVDDERVAALEAAVSAGEADSVQAAVESALDAWLTEQMLKRVSDAKLQQLWRDGLESGEAGTLDLEALKREARGVGA